MEPLTISRRGFLKLASLAGAGWLTPLGEALAQDAERRREPAQSIIMLWLGGGASQLETFDPHPGTAVGGEVRAIESSVRGIRLASTLPRTAEVMDSIAVVRSLVSKEGDHERGTSMVKTGYRPDPTAVYPSIGAILCHELPRGGVEIPRHISILPGRWPARGGFLGDDYDAFRTFDPINPLPDVAAHVPRERDDMRAGDLSVIERAFSRGRRVQGTLHQETIRSARTMMRSEQLRAFDVSQEPLQLRRDYGETPFGRACLAARRLIEVGVRCVEVTLEGWDSHVNNHKLQSDAAAVLDPAFAALIRDLRTRDLLKRTIVIVATEFGRTPRINPLGGRDHWPNGFSIALAGGNIRGGQVIGATDPEGTREPQNPVSVEDIHTTVLTALGIDPAKENISPARRPIRLSNGRVVPALLS
jgi:hypothetical protein